MTGDVINLNKARKAQAKQAHKAQAVENRVKFGRTKGETAAAKAEAAKKSRLLDDAKRDR